MFPNSLLSLSPLVINWTFQFMYSCIYGKAFYVTIYVIFVKMYDLQIILN
jgi:hypothetical protein